MNASRLCSTVPRRSHYSAVSEIRLGYSIRALMVPAVNPTGSTSARSLLHIMNRSPSHSIPVYRSPYVTASTPSSVDALFRDVDCDEVYSRIYVGNEESAKSKKYLKLMGITHVLNTAEGNHFGQVDTNHLYYLDCPRIKYLGFPLIDHPSTDISRYFHIAAKFIAEAVNSGGKVLVHCKMGVSRSATCAIAYLMIERDMSASEAIKTVSWKRSIRPNDGFLRQLCKLDQELSILRKGPGLKTSTISLPPSYWSRRNLGQTVSYRHGYVTYKNRY